VKLCLRSIFAFKSFVEIVASISRLLPDEFPMHQEPPIRRSLTSGSQHSV
jgi:hypothetical protein